MSYVTNRIAKEIKNNPEMEAFHQQEKDKLEAAVALRQLREELGLTQQALADKAGKPQNTIARIENGTVNVSFKTLSEIAAAVGKEVQISFV